jgi:IS5 family transposase
MIRGQFLQYLYQLSDPQLEDQLIDRLSFCRFAGLPLDQTVPDFTTFWRFRECLTTQGLVKELFAQIHRQLEEKGLLLKQGIVVNAAITNSVNRPLSDKKREKLDEKSSLRSTQMLIPQRKAVATILAIRATSGWILPAS